jgi:hypothetical protein
LKGFFITRFVLGFLSDIGRMESPTAAKNEKNMSEQTTPHVRMLAGPKSVV